MKFDAEYVEDATLEGGLEVRLRLIRPDDKEALERGLERLSPESRYRRFFAAKPSLSTQELRYLTEIDGVDHVAIVAVAPDSDEGFGIARFIRLEDEPDSAEAAVVVLDDVQGRGLGVLLLRRLAEAARERGVQWFVADVQSDNERILQTLRSLAPAARCTPREDGTTEVVLPIPEQPEPSSSIERMLAHAAEGAIRVRHRLRRLKRHE